MDGTDVVMGADCKLYRNSASYSTPTWREQDLISGVNVPSSYGEANVTVRASKRKRYHPTLEETAIEIETLLIEDDTDFLALRDAYINKTALDLLITSGVRTETGHLYVRDTYKVFQMNEGEPLEDKTVINWVLKPAFSANAALKGTTPYPPS